MSGPFKMKGWSGNQKSPIQQPKIDFKTSIANIQTSISNIFKGVGTTLRDVGVRPTVGTGKGQITQKQYETKYGKKPPGLGLTQKEKAQAKKFGMSDCQWKTDRNKSGTRANRYARDNKLGKYAEKTKFVDENKDGIPDYIQPIHSTGIPGPGVGEIATEGATETDWITRKGDPWSYKKTDKGYQTRKGDGTVIDVVNKKSKAYQSIAHKVFSEGEKPGPVETKNTFSFPEGEDPYLQWSHEGKGYLDEKSTKFKSDGKGGILFYDKRDKKWRNPKDSWRGNIEDFKPGGKVYEKVYKK